MKLKISKDDRTKKSQMVTKIKNSICDKTQNVNNKKLKNSKYEEEKTEKLKI